MDLSEKRASLLRTLCVLLSLLVIPQQPALWAQGVGASPPTILIDSLRFAEDDTLDLTLADRVRDDETPGKAIRWEVRASSPSPLHFRIDRNNHLLLWADPDWHGRSDLILKATDAQGNSSEKQVPVIVDQTPDIFMGNFVLRPLGVLLIPLRGHIAPDSSFKDVRWRWDRVGPDTLDVRLISPDTLRLRAGRLFVKGPLFLKFYIQDLSGKLLDTDLAVINIDPPRRPPVFLIRDTLFVLNARETRIEKTLLVRDDIDASSQLRLEVQVPPGQPFDAFVRTSPSGRDTLVVRPQTTVDSTGYLVLTAQNSADLRASTQVIVRVVPGPVLALPKYLEVPYNDSTYLPLEGYVRATDPQHPLTWSVQSGIEVDARLFKVRAADLLRSGNFATFPGADSLLGTVDSVHVVRVFGGERFFGLEWLKISVTDRSTGLGDTAALPVYVGVSDQDPRKPSQDIPLPKDPALLSAMLNVKVRTPTGGNLVRRGDKLVWDPMPPLRGQNPRYRLAYGTDERLLDRPVNVVDVGDSTSFTLPDTLPLNVPFWARVLVAYNGLFSFWSDPLLFTGDRPPDPPVLLSPPDRAELDPKALLLRVRAGVDQDGEPTTNRIDAAADSAMQTTADSRLFPNITSPIPLEFRPDSTRLPPGKIYYWRAVSISGGLTTSSPVRSFKLFNLRPPSAVHLVVLSPDSARPVIDLRDSIAWRLDRPDTLYIREVRFRLEVASGYDLAKQELTDVRLDTSGAALTAVRGLDRLLQYGRTYGYRISATFTISTASSREFFKLTTGVRTFWAEHRPEAFQLLSPADGDTLAEKQIPFRWGRAFDADTGDVVNYELQISRQPDFLNLILNQTIAGTTFLVPADSLTARSPSGRRPYYWRVVATDGILKTPSASFRSFFLYTRDDSLRVRLLAPADGKTLDIADPDFYFRWTSLVTPDPVAYILRIGTGPGLSDVLQAPTSDTTYTPPANLLGYRRTYYWSVQTHVLSDLRSHETGEWKFRVEHRPGPFDLTQPAADTVLHRLPVTFRWRSSRTPNSAVSYTLEINTTNTFEKPLFAQDVSTDSFYVMNKPPFDKYDEQTLFWRVRARANGLERLSRGPSGEGDPWSFRINLFALLTPVQGQPIGGASPIFRWRPYFARADQKAARYVLFLTPSPRGSPSPLLAQVESLAVGDPQLSKPLTGDTWYTWRVGALVGPDTIWAAPDSSRFFAGDRRIREFYAYPNPFNPGAGERVQFHATFLKPIARASLRILTAHPPHPPLVSRDLSLDPSGLRFFVPPMWDGRDFLGREMGYGVYIAELTVEYEEDNKPERVYYPVAIGPRPK